MNATTPPRHSPFNTAVAYLITLPILAVERGGQMAKQILTNHQKKVAPTKASPVAHESATHPTESVRPPKTAFLIADRVHSAIVRSQKVCFYEYGDLRQIKATTRVNGCMKEVMFTPEDAAQLSLPFTFETAVTWIQKKGFGKAAEITGNIAPQTAMPAIREPKRAVPAIQAATVTDLPDELVKSAMRPFEGLVLGYGETTKPGRNGEPPYQTFFLALEHSLIGKREFIGEQLAELVANHNLQLGQKVRLHPLGKRLFEVTVKGKPQKRSRNEYSIDLL